MKRTLLSLTLVTLLLAVTVSFAQTSSVYSTAGKAINGYDPVAYFTDSMPVKGDSTITYAYEGTNWLFASAAHRDAFKADPQKYVPQYGGYCAFGTSRGYKAPTQPDAWTIVDDKLYLNYNTKVRAEWTKDLTVFIEKADKNWVEIKNKDPK